MGGKHRPLVLVQERPLPFRISFSPRCSSLSSLFFFRIWGIRLEKSRIG